MKIDILKNRNLNQVIARLVPATILVFAIITGLYIGYYSETYWVGVITFLFILFIGSLFVGFISFLFGVSFITNVFLETLIAWIPKHKNIWMWISFPFTVVFIVLSVLWFINIYQVPPEMAISFIKASVEHWLISFAIMFVGLSLLFLSRIESIKNDLETANNKRHEAEAALASMKARAEDAEKTVAECESKFRSKQSYIDLDRIEELRRITSQKFDLTRLIELCEELNKNYAAENFLAIPMLSRAIIDHIPPIFGFDKFDEVANNYGGQKSFKSFKKSMQNLQRSLRNIADSSIHSTIRKKEILPNDVQVDFSSDMDVLLAEIIRILK